MIGLVRPIATLALCVLFAGPAHAAGESEIKSQDWTFDGPLGTFDQAQLQRGYKIYKEVCSACHSLQYIRFRNLGQPGGPAFSEGSIEALAAGVKVMGDPDDKGERRERPGRAADSLPGPYANEGEARAANGGALPPDLSLIAKAREGGPDYIYALLTGYAEPPADIKMTEGMHYNKAFPGHQLAMPQPLQDGAVEYTDGTAATLDHYARDIAAFLMWTAEPTLEERHALGFRIMLFLIVLAGLTYAAKIRIWKRIKH